MYTHTQAPARTSIYTIHNLLLISEDNKQRLTAEEHSSAKRKTRQVYCSGKRKYLEDNSEWVQRLFLSERKGKVLPYRGAEDRKGHRNQQWKGLLREIWKLRISEANRDYGRVFAKLTLAPILYAQVVKMAANASPLGFIPRLGISIPVQTIKTPVAPLESGTIPFLLSVCRELTLFYLYEHFLSASSPDEL